MNNPIIPDPPPLVAQESERCFVASARTVFNLLRKKKAPKELFALAGMAITDAQEFAAKTDGKLTANEIAKFTADNAAKITANQQAANLLASRPVNQKTASVRIANKLKRCWWHCKKSERRKNGRRPIYGVSKLRPAYNAFWTRQQIGALLEARQVSLHQMTDREYQKNIKAGLEE